MEICRYKVYIQKDTLVTHFIDKIAEWLRRRTVNPLGITHVGSSPFRRFFIWFYGEMNSNLQYEFSNQSSILRKKLLHLKPHPSPSLKI